MNVYDRDAAERDRNRKAAAILSVWFHFRAAVTKLTSSYNCHPVGKEEPAVLTEDDDTLLTIECQRGTAPDGLSVMMVTITAAVDKGEFVIKGAVERWTLHLPGIPRKTESLKVLTFRLHSEERALCLGEETLTPFDAAERLMTSAFPLK